MSEVVELGEVIWVFLVIIVLLMVIFPVAFMPCVISIGKI